MEKSKKLHAIGRISSYLNKSKLRLIMNAFFRPSLDISHLPGCFTIEGITKETVYTNGCLEYSTKTINHLLQNFFPKINHLLYITKMFKN